MNSIQAILDALALQQRGDTSLIVTIRPDLIEDAKNALRGYKTLFAPFIPGTTDTAPIYATYKQMQVYTNEDTVLLFVECQTVEEFRESLGRLPIRHSSEWRAFDDGQ